MNAIVKHINQRGQLALSILHELTRYLDCDLQDLPMSPNAPYAGMGLNGVTGYPSNSIQVVSITATIPIDLFHHLEAFDINGDSDSDHTTENFEPEFDEANDQPPEWRLPTKPTIHKIQGAQL